MMCTSVIVATAACCLAASEAPGWKPVAQHEAERPRIAAAGERRGEDGAVAVAFAKTSGWSLAVFDLRPVRGRLDGAAAVVFHVKAAGEEDVGARLRVSYKRTDGKRTWVSPWPALSAEWRPVFVPVVGEADAADCVTLAPAGKGGGVHLLIAGPGFRRPTTVADLGTWPHAPLTIARDEPTPPIDRPWREPNVPELPTAEALRTVTVRGRTFEITGVHPDANGAPGLALHEPGDRALYFTGTGGGGLRSGERLIVEDCTFVLDFREGDFARWDARRCAVFVQGYREVLVRRCRFVSRGGRDDPARKTNASVTCYDCLRVQIEDCSFAGKTNWMRGHVTVFCCGPTRVRRVEVSGIPDEAGGVCGGGVWIANGLGEGKIGTLHADEPELMLYPSGPAVIEDCHIRDQRGRHNADGIYIQSIHNYVIRNCKVSDWGKDALVDVGFRDTSVRRWRGRRLRNHGSMGLIEHCEFAGGFLKDSVGAGGGLIFRGNLLRNCWLMPYIFDGGGWWVVGNAFVEQSVPVLSGFDGATGGWGPVMFANGSRAFVYGNLVRTSAERPPAALYVANKHPDTPLTEHVVADWNAYDLAGEPRYFARDVAAGKTWPDFAAWRQSTCRDRHSVAADAIPPAFRAAGAIPLPGGLTFRPGPIKPGLTGPVGPRDLPERQGDLGMR